MAPAPAEPAPRKCQGSGAFEPWVPTGADALMGTTRVLVKEPQDKVLALFRRGHSNLLFTTSVAEEGLDVQHCSLVICYDVPTRPLSLMQTVGRVRAHNAEVVFMEEVTSEGTVHTVPTPSPLLSRPIACCRLCMHALHQCQLCVRVHSVPDCSRVNGYVDITQPIAHCATAVLGVRPRVRRSAGCTIGCPP